MRKTYRKKPRKRGHHKAKAETILRSAARKKFLSGVFRRSRHAGEQRRQRGGKRNEHRCPLGRLFLNCRFSEGGNFRRSNRRPSARSDWKSRPNGESQQGNISFAAPHTPEGGKRKEIEDTGLWPCNWRIKDRTRKVKSEVRRGRALSGRRGFLYFAHEEALRAGEARKGHQRGEGKLASGPCDRKDIY